MFLFAIGLAGSFALVVKCNFDANKCSPANSSVEPLHRSHGGLDMQRPHILPMLLQQGHQEIHGEVNILHKVVLRHAHVADGDGQAKHLEKRTL